MDLFFILFVMLGFSSILFVGGLIAWALGLDD